MSLRGLAWPLMAALCLALALVPASPVSSPAREAARDVAAASLGVYVALRSINAALSFAQEIEVGGSIGVSANAQPLKFLEPVDDTVERVSSVVFWVALVAGAMVIGVEPVSRIGFLLLAAGLVIRWLRQPLIARVGPAARPVCRAGEAFDATGLVLALLLPLSIALGSGLGDALTADEWEAARADLGEITSYASSLLGGTGDALPDDVTEPDEGGVMRWLRDLLETTGDGFGSAAERTGKYLDAAGYFIDEADRLFGASMTILAIFLLRTLILPLALMLAMVVLARRLLRV